MFVFVPTADRAVLHYCYLDLLEFSPCRSYGHALDQNYSLTDNELQSAIGPYRSSTSAAGSYQTFRDLLMPSSSSPKRSCCQALPWALAGAKVRVWSRLSVLSRHLFLVCCFDFLPSRPTLNEPHAHNSRRPVWAGLPTNGFASHLCLSGWRGNRKGSRVLVRSTSILPVESDERNTCKLPCQPPPPDLTTSRWIPARSCSSRMFSLSLVNRQGCDKQRVRFHLSPLQLSSCTFRSRKGRLISTEFIRVCGQTSLCGLLPPNPKYGRPRRNRVSDGNREGHQPGHSQTGPRTLLQERER